jgi:hypothetical protein
LGQEAEREGKGSADVTREGAAVIRKETREGGRNQWRDGKDGEGRRGVVARKTRHPHHATKGMSQARGREGGKNGRGGGGAVLTATLTPEWRLFLADIFSRVFRRTN